MLQLIAVTKRFGPLAALDDVSLEIARGEFFGLLGSNGAGKSILASLVAGVREPDAFGGNPDPARRRRRFGGGTGILPVSSHGRLAHVCGAA